MADFLKGIWRCTHCGNIEAHEREIVCWRCGNGQMVFIDCDTISKALAKLRNNVTTISPPPDKDAQEVDVTLSDLIENEAYEIPAWVRTCLRGVRQSVRARSAGLTASDEVVAKNLAMMLRRFIWQANKEVGDTSMKVLAGSASKLLAQYGLEGNPIRHD